ncbi:MAG: hypothetical protein JSS66_05495 [Armatimonadetes bacterium]|nr:hypothetical protein [Armatimonadota bacterium]
MIGAIKWGDKAGIVLQESYATRQPTDADLQNAIDAMLDANALTLQARTFSFKPMLLSLFVIGAGFVAGALIAIWIL